MSGEEAPQTWATVPHEWRGKKVTLFVDDVRSQSKTIRVIYHTTKDAAPPGQKSASAHHDSPLLFALATGGACGLVLLAPARAPSGAT